jgi:hypothetical protein
MIRRLVVMLITILSFQLSAQETISPYSFYGLGSLKLKGTVENRSMGGLSVYMDSIHMNFRNPASYVSKNVEDTKYEGESRPVKYAVGGSYVSTNITSNNGTTSFDNGSFDYFAFNFPIGKFGIAFGTMPLSKVGYKLNDTNDEGLIQNRYQGEGGLSRVFSGIAYRFNDNLSLGVDVNYNFGNIDNSALAFIFSDGIPLELQSQEENRSDLSGLNFNFGLSYKARISRRLELMASLAYTPESNLSSQNQRAISTVRINNVTGAETVINNVVVDLEESGLAQTDLTLPSRFAVGLGVGQPRIWFIGAEYTALSNSQFGNPIFDIDISDFENSNGFSVGGFIIPKYNAFRGYFKRVVYRAGFRTENTGLVINGETIREFGISFGVGLPLGFDYSDVNLGFEYGQRGTTNQNLVKEDFFSFSISLSLNDRWFKRRKYN